MYPQYASASTGSSLEGVFKALAKVEHAAVTWRRHSTGNAGFIDAFASLGSPSWNRLAPDHVLFSYHGLPERQIRRSETGGPLPQGRRRVLRFLSGKNNICYRAQCFETSPPTGRPARACAGQYTVFQSRLGRTPWIKPYTDLVIAGSGRQGKKRVLVFEPSSRPIAWKPWKRWSMRASATFLEAGGDELRLVPSLNADPTPGCLPPGTGAAKPSSGPRSIASRRAERANPSIVPVGYSGFGSVDRFPEK